MTASAQAMRGSIEYVELATGSGRVQGLHIYLPPSYANDTERGYPVLYMHFGQHLFEPKHVGGESWQLHRRIEGLLERELIEEIVVVGIDALRGSSHTDAYHYANLIDEFPCTGMAYESLILGEVMPHVEEHFRVLQGPEHTSMIGACAGAVISHNIAVRHPGVFGKIGLLSVLARSLQNVWLLGPKDSRPQALCWIDGGGAEGFFPAQFRELLDGLIANGAKLGVDLFCLLEPDGFHSDASWGERMTHPLLLFYGNVGKPVSAELHGGDVVGTGLAPLFLNPILQYNSGFRTSLLDADYAVANPAIVRIERNGRTYGLAEGRSEVSFRAHGLAASRTIRVTSGLPESVVLTMRVRVAEDRPTLSKIYFNSLGLTRSADGTYEGEFPLPRGYALLERFSCGMRKFELRHDGSPAPLRRIQADADATFEFLIERWPELPLSSKPGIAE